MSAMFLVCKETLRCGLFDTRREAQDFIDFITSPFNSYWRAIEAQKYKIKKIKVNEP